MEKGDDFYQESDYGYTRGKQQPTRKKTYPRIHPTEEKCDRERAAAAAARFFTILSCNMGKNMVQCPLSDCLCGVLTIE